MNNKKIKQPLKVRIFSITTTLTKMQMQIQIPYLMNLSSIKLIFLIIIITKTTTIQIITQIIIDPYKYFNSKNHKMII